MVGSGAWQPLLGGRARSVTPLPSPVAGERTFQPAIGSGDILTRSDALLVCSERGLDVPLVFELLPDQPVEQLELAIEHWLPLGWSYRLEILQRRMQASRNLRRGGTYLPELVERKADIPVPPHGAGYEPELALFVVVLSGRERAGRQLA